MLEDICAASTKVMWRAGLNVGCLGLLRFENYFVGL